MLVVDGQSLREQPHVPAFLGQIAGCHQKRVHRFVQHLVRGLRQFGGGEIDSGPQQPQNAARRQSPGDHGFAVSGADAVALGKADTIFHKPHSVFAALVLDAAPILHAKLPTQKCYIFLFRMLPHIEHSDTLRTVGFIARRAEDQVDDLLRHRVGRSQNAGGRIRRDFIHRLVAAHIK